MIYVLLGDNNDGKCKLTVMDDNNSQMCHDDNTPPKNFGLDVQQAIMMMADVNK